MKLRYAVSLAIGCLGACASSAATITTLYNTGVDASGTPLSNGDPELHYTLYSQPAGQTYTPRVARDSNGYPMGYWSGDNSTSAWIGPNSDSALNGATGDYDYRLTFSLAGYDFTTAAISGAWATDDGGLSILLNGVALGSTSGGYTGFTSFSASSGFVAGLNTLDFIVNNSGGPTGLRVQVSGTADLAASAAPEPTSWALMIVGFGAVGLALRGRRGSSVTFA